MDYAARSGAREVHTPLARKLREAQAMRSALRSGADLLDGEIAAD